MALYSPAIQPHSCNLSNQPALDLVRGVAALWILSYHLFHLLYAAWYGREVDYLQWPQQHGGLGMLLAPLIEGHAAVGVFFVLSGLLFTLVAGERPLRLAGFWRNRLLRIYPLYTLWLLAGILAAPAALSAGGLLMTLLGGANLAAAYQSYPFTGMFWSIAVELQFYAIFPLLLLLLQRGGVRALLGVLLLWLLLQPWLLQAYGGNVRDWSYWTLAGRLPQFLLGMLAGWFWLRRACALPAAGWQALAALLALGMALLALHRAGGWPVVAGWRGYWPVLEGALAAWLMLCLLALQPRFSPILVAAAGWLADRSYALYLGHMPVIALVLWGWPLPAGAAALSVAGRVVACGLLALLLAEICHRWIEAPCLALRRRYVG